MAAHVSQVQRVIGGIGGAFNLGQVRADSLGTIVGQLFADQVLDAPGVDDGADQLIDAPATIGLLLLVWIRGGQTEARGGGSHQRRFSPRRRGQVVYFVKNDELELVSVLGDQVTG